MFHIHGYPDDADIFQAYHFKCPMRDLKKAEIRSTETTPEFQGLWNLILDGNIRESQVKPLNLSDMREAVVTHTCTGQPTPCDGRSVCLQGFEHDVMRLSSERLALVARDANLNLTRLVGGAMWTRLVNNMKAKINGRLKTKFHLYSAHDDTLGAILGAIRYPLLSWPPYASSLAIELWRREKDGIYFVHLLYNGKSIPALEVDPLADTTLPVYSWTEFHWRLSPVLVEDLTQECGL